MNPNFQISEVDFFPIEPRQGLIGFASLTLDNSLQLKGLAVHTRPDGGIRIVFPTKVLPNGSSVPLIRPLDSTINKQFEKVVNNQIQKVIYDKEKLHN